MSTKPFVRYNVFSEDFAKGVHQLHAAGHTLKLALSNTAPDVANHTVLADISEIAAGNGYTAGGEDVQNTIARTAAVTTLFGVDVTWQAAGGSIGPFRYAIIYNATASGGPLIGYWDKETSITLDDGESFTTDFLSSDSIMDIG